MIVSADSDNWLGIWNPERAVLVQAKKKMFTKKKKKMLEPD